MIGKQLGYGAIALAAIALLVFLVVRSIDVDRDKHQDLVALADELKRIDGVLNLDVVRLRGGHLFNYDTIVETNRQISVGLAEAKYRLTELLGDDVESINLLLAELDTTQFRRERQLEQFNARNAVLKNSIRYLPLMVSEIIEGTGAQHDLHLVQVLNQLLRHTLIVSLHGKQAEPSMFAELTGRLEGISRDRPAELREELNILITHARIIVKNTAIVDRLIRQVLAIGFADSVDALHAAYDVEYEIGQGFLPLYQIALGIYATILLLTIVIVIIKLAKARRDLAQSHLTLEDGIELRTKELSERTEQLQDSQARFAGILDIASDAVISTDDTGLILLFNKGAETIFGYTADEVLGQPLEILLPRHLRDAHSGHISAFTGAPEVTRLMGPRGVVNGLRKDGTEFPAETSISKLVQGNHNILTAILRDITEHNKIKGDLLAATAQAEAANRAKSNFLATMSHEIRTPMNGVIGMADLLLDTDLDAEQRKYAASVQGSSHALLTIINDVLDFSKLEAGKFEFEAIDFNLPDVIEGVMELLRPSAMERGLDLATYIAPSAPKFLNGDPGRLRQILLNLAGNAVKFTETGSVAVTASLAAGKDGMTTLRFEVTDTGIGVPAEFQAELFEKFSQADSSTMRSFGGTGLGLAICKQIVTLMGGTIGIKSGPDKGSIFWFTACFGTASSNDGLSREVYPKELAEIGPEASAGDVDTQSIRPMKILVAEDNQTNQFLARATLEKQGHRVEIVNNGIDAVKAVRLTSYDLVLMDVNMPEKDGVEATADIRELDGEKGRIPIIALTANALKGDKERFLAAGMNDYLSKPLDRKKLVAAINAWTGGSNALDGTPSSDPRAMSEAAEVLDPAILEDWRTFLPAEQFATLIEEQVTDSRASLQRLKEAVEAGAFDDAGKLAHELTGSCGAIGMLDVQRLAKNLELACMEERREDALALAPAVDEAVGTAVTVLKTRYANE